MRSTKINDINILEMDYHPGYERLIFFSHDTLGVEGIIAVHSTLLGYALGGCRLYNYSSFNEGLNDVLLLAKSMSYKNAIIGLPYGGGKAVIFDRENIKKDDALRVLSEVLNHLAGLYYTTDDVGTSVIDIEYIRNFTSYARGEFVEKNVQIPATSYGVYKAIKAATDAYSMNDPSKIKIFIQGLGKVGYSLCKFLHDDGYDLYVSDLKSELVTKAVEQFRAKAVAPDIHLEHEVDVFVPCAMGGVITPNNVFRIKAGYIIGAANNQLVYEHLDDLLWKRGIKYIPDYLCNAGGVIDIACEGKNYSKDYVYNNVNVIYDKVLDLINISQNTNVSPMRVANQQVADLLKQKKIEQSKQKIIV